MTTARSSSLVAALVAGAACLIAPAGSAAAQTLREAVETALATNPEFAAARDNHRAVGHAVRQSRGRYFPAIDLRGAGGHQFSNTPSTRARPGREDGEDGRVDMNRYEAGLSVRQLLFDGFATDHEVERRLGRQHSARFDAFGVAEQIGLDAIEAYLDVFRSRQIVAVAEENVAAHRRLLRLVDLRAQGGRGPRSDVDQADARVASARAALARARGRLGDAEAAYRKVVGLAPPTLAPVAAPEASLPPTVEEAVAIALDAAPEVSAARARVKAARGAVGVARAAFWPRADLELDANRNRNLDGVRGPDNEYQALVVLRYNLFRGGIDTARRREALARLARARDQLDMTRREVEERVRTSWSALEAARGRRAALGQQVAAVARVLAAFSRQFELGQRTFLDLLDIRNELFVTQTALITEEATVVFGAYRVLTTMGRLLRTLKIAIPEDVAPGPG